MRVLSAVSALSAVLLIGTTSFTGCVSHQPPKSPGPPGIPSKPVTVRVPLGSNTRHNASVQFFNAYKTHDRAAAREVATDAAIDALVFNASAGTNPTLQLVDDTHIYYEGGGIEMTLASNADGRWYVRSVTLRAD